MTFGRGGPTVADLVKAGVARVGDQWFHRGRHARVVAVVFEDGIRLGDRGFDNPSRAAKAASGSIQNGWEYWRFERDGQLIPIDELRRDYQKGSRQRPASSRKGRGTAPH